MKAWLKGGLIGVGISFVVMLLLWLLDGCFFLMVDGGCKHWGLLQFIARPLENFVNANVNSFPFIIQLFLLCSPLIIAVAIGFLLGAIIGRNK